MKSQRRRRAERRRLVAKERLRVNYMNVFDPHRPDWARQTTREEKAALTVMLDAWGLYV